jgi:hypothetical protein
MKEFSIFFNFIEHSFALKHKYNFEYGKREGGGGLDFEVV